jgi:DNA-binding response OmpR family regulator
MPATNRFGRGLEFCLLQDSGEGRLLLLPLQVSHRGLLGRLLEGTKVTSPNKNEGDSAMGAVAKNPIPQLMPAAAHPLSRIFLNDLPAAMRIMGLNEARQLSQFVPVIALVPASSTEDGIVPSKTARNDSPGATTATSRLVEFFSKATPPPKTKNAESEFVFGGVKVSFSSMEASRKGEPVMLTALEFKTLKYLAQNVRRVISRDELLNKVWGYENYPCTRTVDNRMLKLRQKLERDPSRPVHFLTVRGAGYKFLP